MAPEADFLTRLDEELSSCQMQTVNIEDATTEDIVKDLHRMLTGNGGPTRGLIVKVAAANVSIKDLQDRVGNIDQSVAAQKKTCQEFRTKSAIHQAEHEGAAAKKIVKVLWDNRAVLLVLLFAGIVYLATGWRREARDIKFNTEINSVVEKKLEKLLVDVDFRKKLADKQQKWVKENRTTEQIGVDWELACQRPGGLKVANQER